MFGWVALLSMALAGAACTEVSPAFGQYYQGRTLVVSVVSIDRVSELRYSSGLPGQQARHLRVTPSEDSLELVAVHLKVENHSATSAIFNVDRTGAELRDFLSKKYSR